MEKCYNDIFHIQYDFTLFSDSKEESLDFLNRWIKLFNNDIDILRREILLSRLEGV